MTNCSGGYVDSRRGEYVVRGDPSRSDYELLSCRLQLTATKQRNPEQRQGSLAVDSKRQRTSSPTCWAAVIVWCSRLAQVGSIVQ